MKISKKENISARTERKARKRKLQGMIPDLPGDCEDAVTQDSSGSGVADGYERYKEWKGGHIVIQGAHAARARKPLKDASEDTRKIKKSKLDMLDRESSKIRITELVESEEIRRDDIESQLDEKSPCETDSSSVILSENQAAAPLRSRKLRKAERKITETLSNNIAKSTIVQDAVVTSSAGNRPGKSNRGDRARKTKLEGLNGKAGSFIEGELAEGIENKPTRFIVFIGELGDMFLSPHQVE
jgi:hypothetical protein